MDPAARPMHEAEVVALAYRYPAPGSLVRLTEATGGLAKGAVRRNLERFLAEVGELDLGEWEELHTATLDLSPQFVPYVGHVAWGENYRRGEFMAALKADMERHGIDLCGELPDHIEPVLRYVANVPAPRADLIEVLAASVATMSTTLAAASAGNPYRYVLAATHAAVDDPTPVLIGVRR